jgi:hypothetical protein
MWLASCFSVYIFPLSVSSLFFTFLQLQIQPYHLTGSPTRAGHSDSPGDDFPFFFFLFSLFCLIPNTHASSSLSPGGFTFFSLRPSLLGKKR